MCAETPKNPRRVFFYVDGFNLYHRRLEKEPSLKWLCLRKLAETHLFPQDSVEIVKLFTAKVDPDADPERPTAKQRRQSCYWEALRRNRVEIIEGILEPRERTCKADQCGKYETFRQMSEKMSDVNLALHVYRDFIELQPDVVCVLSGDCDVLPAIKMVREHATRNALRVMTVIYLPIPDDGLLFSRLPKHYQIARTARLGESALRLSQLPDVVEIGAETFVARPDNWR